MAKFKVGEVVIFAKRNPDCATNVLPLGGEVEVVAAGPILCRMRHGISFADYAVRGNGGVFACDEWQLRKPRPPEEPGSWSDIERITGWNPTRVTA